MGTLHAMAAYNISDAEHAQARAIWEREPTAANWEDELARAREVVAAVGDLPPDITYEMLMHGGAPEAVTDPLAVIMALRPAGAGPYPDTGRI
jgi:hypothetical protein